MTNTMSEDRLRNVRAWAASRPDMSGSEVIVGAIDELLHLREVLTFPIITPEATSSALFIRTLREHEKGQPVNGQDLINALMWRVKNQRQEIARLQQVVADKEDDCARLHKQFMDAKYGPSAEPGAGQRCSVCGATPAVQVHGTYYLCGPCVLERVEPPDLTWQGRPDPRPIAPWDRKELMPYMTLGEPARKHEEAKYERELAAWNERHAVKSPAEAAIVQGADFVLAPPGKSSDALRTNDDPLKSGEDHT